MKFTKKPESPNKLIIIEADLKMPETTELPLPNKSFGLVKNVNNVTGWSLVTVAFDPVTLESKVLEVKRVGDSREEAEYSFKVMVGKNFAEIQ